MKSILIIFLLSPFVVFAQLTPDRYQVKLANGNRYIELSSATAIKVAQNCTSTGVDCATQELEIVAVEGRSNVFHIKSISNGKYLSWNNEPVVSSRVAFMTQYPIERIRFQSFLITMNDKGSYNIQPAIERPSVNNYYLATKLSAGSNQNVVGVVNKMNVDWTRGDYDISWLFVPIPIITEKFKVVAPSGTEITKTPIKPEQPGVVYTPAPKPKLLPIKPEQPGVVSQPVNNNSPQPEPPRATVATRPTIKIETLTGGDDLRGGRDNLNVSIRLKTTPVRTIALSNINGGEKWDNLAEKTITKTITAPSFTFDDIGDIVLRHTGGGGIGADNWYLDKLKITLTINGETRVLVNQVVAPIHYFTGDSRSKTFQILR